jgi:uncharacterized protein YdeI (YjbR/CyaY-like superfamily)
MTKQVDDIEEHFSENNQWKDERRFARNLFLQLKLKEEWKWSSPCYTYKGANIVLIGGYKSFFAISFLKGVLLNDPTNSLVFAGENSKIAKLIKVKSIQELKLKKEIIENLIKEAILVEEKNLKVVPKQNEKLNFPLELVEKLNSDEEFNRAFIKLTKGRQRGYAIFIKGENNQVHVLNE